MKYALAIDIGATYIRVAIGTSEGKIISKTKEKTPRRGNEYTITNKIVSIVRKKFSKYIRNVTGIGIGAIGPLDLKRGRIISPPNIPFKTVELVDPLAEKFNVEVKLCNDAVTAVWGEKIYGLGRNVKNLAYVTLSTGIGVGIIVDDHLLMGKDGNAHELGHSVVDFNGLMTCSCGKIGHWEAYCSGKNIPEYAKYLVKIKYSDLLEKSILKNKVINKTLSAKDVFEAAKRDDVLALKIIYDLGKVNAAGFANIINGYDPELITIGGAIALNNPSLVLKPLMKYLRHYVINRMPKIRITPLGEDIVLYGALALVFKPPEPIGK